MRVSVVHRTAWNISEDRFQVHSRTQLGQDSSVKCNFALVGPVAQSMHVPMQDRHTISLDDGSLSICLAWVLNELTQNTQGLHAADTF